jgi:sulfatase modifying factor 1
MKVLRVFASFLLASLSCTLSDEASIDTVPVGNAGNAGDVQSNGTFGSVPYAYRIGKHEVTNAQYTAFLNSVDATGMNTLTLYNSLMSSDAHGGINFNVGAANGSKYENKPGRNDNPVVFVSWFDAIRFANWLHNGQGSGDTESGAYTLLGGTPTPSNGDSITRNLAAMWWLPSEDEWYKAAYHKNDGPSGNYWNFPTSTNAGPYSDQPPGSDAPAPSRSANFFKNDNIANGYDDGFAVTGSASFNIAQNYLTDVGAYTLSNSPYGTFDQGGNVWEWNETLISGSDRGLRGGDFGDAFNFLHASSRDGGDPTFHFNFLGFRVASIVPEPSTLALAMMTFLLAPWRPRTRIATAT